MKRAGFLPRSLPRATKKPASERKERMSQALAANQVATPWVKVDEAIMHHHHIQASCRSVNRDTRSDLAAGDDVHDSTRWG